MARSLFPANAWAVRWAANGSSVDFPGRGRPRRNKPEDNSIQGRWHRESPPAFRLSIPQNKMKLLLAILTLTFTASLACPVLAQAQKQVCHTPDATKASTKPAQLMEGYGKVHMAITTKSELAQKFFDQGLALLHSFWFYEADRSFERAAQLDAECAMPHWGIAMAAVNNTRRDAAVKRAKELAPNASEREKLYIAAVEARYQGERATIQNNGFLGASEPYQTTMRKIVGFYPTYIKAKL